MYNSKLNEYLSKKNVDLKNFYKEKGTKTLYKYLRWQQSSRKQ